MPISESAKLRRSGTVPGRSLEGGNEGVSARRHGDGKAYFHAVVLVKRSRGCRGSERGAEDDVEMQIAPTASEIVGRFRDQIKLDDAG